MQPLLSLLHGLMAKKLGAYEPCYQSQQLYGNFSIKLIEWNNFVYGIVVTWTMVSAFEQLG